MCIPCGSLALPKPQAFLGTNILLLLANEEVWRVTQRGSLILVGIIRSPDTAVRPRLLIRGFHLNFNLLVYIQQTCHLKRWFAS